IPSTLRNAEDTSPREVYGAAMSGPPAPGKDLDTPKENTFDYAMKLGRLRTGIDRGGAGEMEQTRRGGGQL
ncbi:MAG: hypothetical protein ACREJW_11010, partial [Candidatus Methylomirabilales bacterium]